MPERLAGGETLLNVVRLLPSVKKNRIVRYGLILLIIFKYYSDNVSVESESVNSRLIESIKEN